MICCGHYYEEWKTETKKVKIFDTLVPTFVLLHIIMSTIIRLKKKRWRSQDEMKASIGNNAGVKNHNKKMINFGGLNVGWILGCTCVSQVYCLIQIENKIDPKMLNAYPNNLYIYMIHFFNPLMMILPLATYYYLKNKDLRKAIKETIVGSDVNTLPNLTMSTVIVPLTTLPNPIK